MKIIIFLLFFMLCNVYAVHGEASISLGILGFSFNSEVGDNSGFIYGNFIKLAYEMHNGIGISFSPFVFFICINSNDSALTFINPTLYYNILNKRSRYFVLCPFISINAIRNDWPQFVEYYSGISFSLRNINIEGYYSRDSIFSSDFFFVDLGYRYNKLHKHRFYVHFGIDIITAAWLAGFGRISEYEKQQREQPRF
ncbi:MAG: hypothetical protein FWD40_12045 [Treponema sp.]|nr:hypothetical protein [Treponema sp.]